MKDPKVPIHNNASESALRVVALGRKNYLFFGNEDAARNLSILYTLVISCEKNGINPTEYIAEMFRRLPFWPAKKIDELLPNRWRPPRSPPPPADAQQSAA